jgi:hypothetical protein
MVRPGKRRRRDDVQQDYTIRAVLRREEEQLQVNSAVLIRKAY